MHSLLRVTPKRSVRRQAGFSLVEMIGVLAIIAILAVVIVPKVFSTIASSRVTATVASVNSIKTSVTEYVGRFGAVPLTNANSRVDDLLVAAQLMDARFTVKIGTQPSNPPVVGATWNRNAAGAWVPQGGANQGTQSRIICVNSNTNAPSAANGANYRLNSPTVDLPASSRVISAVIVGVTGKEAQELSQRIDGDTASQPTAATADNDGRVVYAAPNGQGVTNAFIYLVHQ